MSKDCMANLTADEFGILVAKALLEIQSSAAWFIFQQAVKEIPDNEDMEYGATEVWLKALIAKAPPHPTDGGLREALRIAIDAEHPDGLKKHKCVTIACEGQPREPTRPEEFEFCEGVMAMAYEVHCILEKYAALARPADPSAPISHDEKCRKRRGGKCDCGAFEHNRAISRPAQTQGSE